MYQHEVQTTVQEQGIQAIVMHLLPGCLQNEAAALLPKLYPNKEPVEAAVKLGVIANNPKLQLTTFDGNKLQLFELLGKGGCATVKQGMYKVRILDAQGGYMCNTLGAGMY